MLSQGEDQRQIGLCCLKRLNLLPDSPIAGNWAILEIDLGAEVFLEWLKEWKQAIESTGAKIVKTQPGEVFQLYKVKFA